MLKIYNPLRFFAKIILCCATVTSIYSSVSATNSLVDKREDCALQCPPVFQNVPANVTVECDQVPPISNGVTASSCCPIISLTVSEDKDIGIICGDDYTLTRIWTATDNCGNMSTTVQIVKVVDTTPPFFINPPGDISGECNPIPPIPVIQAGDNCDNNVFSLLVETQLPGPCYGTYNLTRLWVIRDNCDNANFHVQVVTIKDVGGPSFTLVPPNLTISCNDPIPVAIPGIHVDATDSCNPNVIITQSETQIPGVCPIFYTIHRVFIANDGCGNTSSATQTIAVRDDSPPVINNVPPNITVTCNAPQPAGPSATDNCDDDPQLTVVDEIMSGGGCGEDVVLKRIWTAIDGCGNTSTASQLVTVRIMGEIEFNNVPNDVTVQCHNIPAPPNVMAADACGLPLAVILTSTTIPGNCDQSYQLIRTWTTSDPCGNTASEQQIITVRDITPPVISAMPMDVTVNCGNIPNPASVTATDACDPNPTIQFTETVSGMVCDPQIITRTWIAIDDCGNSKQVIQKIYVQDDQPPVVLNPPADLTISCAIMPPAIPTLQVSDDCGSGNVDIKYQEFITGNVCDAQMLGRVWTVTDECGNSVILAQMITILDDTPPVVIAPADITVDCSEVPNLLPPFIKDDCDPNPTVQFTEMSTPGQCPVAYTQMRTWKVTDKCGNMATDTQNVVVIDALPPIIEFIHPLLVGLQDGDTFKIACDQPVIFDLEDVSVTDNCDPDPSLWMEEELIEVGPCLIFMLCTFVAEDECGNQSTLSFYYLIGDDEPPVLIGVPADLTLECDQPVPSPANVTATDNCAIDIEVTYAEAVIPGACPESYMIIRTWTAEDECGNSITRSQKITIRDTKSPVWMPMHPILIGFNSGDTLFFECDGVILLTADDLIAKDNCDAEVTKTFEEVITLGDCETDGYFIKMVCTWTATDNCGNTTSFIVVAIITDKTPPVISMTPKDLTLSCDDPIPTVPAITAVDNCDGEVEVNFTNSIIPGSCPQNYMILNTWTAIDSCGNLAQRTQKISILDQTPPVFTEAPQNLTIECSDPVPSGQPKAEDNCDPTVTITFDQKTATGNCIGSYLIIREWIATDACGNSATTLQLITVEDTTPPVLLGFPSDVTVECSTIPLPAQIKAADNCDPDVDVTYQELRVNGNCLFNYTLLRTWTATDDCGNELIRTQKITVRDTQAPVLSGIPSNITIECDVPVPAPPIVTAQDNCDTNPIVTLTSLNQPGNCPESFLMVRTWTATDACGNTRTGSQTISIRDTKAPVFVNVPTNLELECSDPIPSQNPTVTDNCDNNPTITVVETKLPGQCDQEYILIRVWTATDNCGNSSTAQQIIKVQDTTPPVIMTLHPGLNNVSSGDTLYYECDDVIIYEVDDVKATDNCDPKPVITFDELLYEGDCTQDGFLLQMHCTWTATDDCGNSSSFFIVVRIVDNTPPVLSGVPVNVTIECDEPLPNSGNVTAEDNCTEIVTITVSDQIVIGNCKENYTIIRTWTATDDCDNSVTAQQQIKVQDTTPPVIFGIPADLTIECDQPLPNTANVTVSDNCDSDPVLTFKEARQDGNCPQEYLLLRIWQAEDNCGNIATVTQKITVVDTTPPLLLGIPADVTVECDAVPTPPSVKAVDNCDPSVPVVYNQQRINGNCLYNYTLIRTWTATDDCGNTGERTQKITVQDTEEPIFTQLPADLTLSCELPWPEVDYEAVDNCSHTLHEEISIEGGKPCDNIPDIRIIRISDECGNEAIAIQHILLIDTSPPFFKPFDQKITVDCDELLDLPLPEAMDNCDDDVDVSVHETKVPGKCAYEYTLLRIFTAIDDCGNTATDIQLISVIDDEAPILIPVDPILQGVPNGSTLVFNCEDAPALNVDAFTATDNCDPDPEIIFEEEIVLGNCLTDGYYLLMTCTWIATDACGNSSSYTIYVKITDTEAPAFTDIPVNVTIGCEDPLPTNEPNVSDNCSPNVVVVEQDVQTILNCGYLITRTWTATDECGNSTQAVQLITITDNDAPYFNTIVDDITVNLDLGEQIPAAPVVTADDDCHDVTVSFTSVQEPGEDCGYIVIRTWTAIDDCGNSAQLIQRITALQACPCIEPEVDTIIFIQPDCGENNGTISVFTVNDPALYDFIWVPSKGQPNAVGNSRSGLGKGTYTILVQDPKASNCFTKLNVTLETQGSCMDTIHVSIPINDAFTVCVDSVLDFEGSVVDASVCGQDANEVAVIVQPGSDCVLLLPAQGFTGTAEVCVIHCNDEVPAVCDTTIILITINALQPCDPVFTSGANEINLPDCEGQAEICLLVDPILINDYLILIDGSPYTGQITTCGPGNIGILVGVGEYTFEITQISTQCVDSRNFTVKCPNEFLLAVDDTVSTSKNQGIEIAVLQNDIIPTGKTVESFEITTQPGYGRVEVQPDLKVLYFPDKDYCGRDVFTYKICIEPEYCDEAIVDIDVTCKGLVVHTGMSPNGDNINDKFTIDGIEDYPQNELTIFNRWGNQVYYQKGYKNNWEGSWNDAALPDGTYFYFLKDGEGEIYSGYLQIHR